MISCINRVLFMTNMFPHCVNYAKQSNNKHTYCVRIISVFAIWKLLLYQTSDDFSWLIFNVIMRCHDAEFICIYLYIVSATGTQLLRTGYFQYTLRIFKFSQLQTEGTSFCVAETLCPLLVLFLNIIQLLYLWKWLLRICLLVVYLNWPYRKKHRNVCIVPLPRLFTKTFLNNDWLM